MLNIWFHPPTLFGVYKALVGEVNKVFCGEPGRERGSSEVPHSNGWKERGCPLSTKKNFRSLKVCCKKRGKNYLFSIAERAEAIDFLFQQGPVSLDISRALWPETGRYRGYREPLSLKVRETALKLHTGFPGLGWVSHQTTPPGISWDDCQRLGGVVTGEVPM